MHRGRAGKQRLWLHGFYRFIGWDNERTVKGTIVLTDTEVNFMAVLITNFDLYLKILPMELRT